MPIELRQKKVIPIRDTIRVNTNTVIHSASRLIKHSLIVMFTNRTLHHYCFQHRINPKNCKSYKLKYTETCKSVNTSGD